jgi:hypothetical protein
VKKEGLIIADEIIAVAQNTDVMILIVRTGFVIYRLQSTKRFIFWPSIQSARIMFHSIDSNCRYQDSFDVG